MPKPAGPIRRGHTFTHRRPACVGSQVRRRCRGYLAARRFVASLTFYASPDLLNWLPIRTVPNPTGVLQFTNSDPVSFGTRFYKTRAE